MLAQLVEQGICHHWSRAPVGVEAELIALGVIVTTVVRKDGVADPGQMRRLSKVVAPSTSPDQDVVSHVPDCIVSSLLRACQRAAECGNVLMVPSVSIRDGGPLGDARDLIAVVPPGHDARILRCILVNPLVALEVIVDQGLLSITLPDLVHYLWVRQRTSDHVAVLHEGWHPSSDAAESEDVKNKNQRHQAAAEKQRWVAVQLLACLAVGAQGGLWPGRQHLTLHHPNEMHGAPRTTVLLPLLKCPVGSVRGTRLCSLLATVRGGLATVWGSLAADGGGLNGLCVPLLSENQQEWLKQVIEQEATPKGASNRDDGRTDQNQAGHFAREVVGNVAVEAKEVETVVTLPSRNDTSEHHVFQRQIQVSAVHPSACRLMLSHGVHQGVSCLCVLHEQASDARRHRTEPSRWIQHDSDTDECDSQHDNHLDTEFGKLRRTHLALAPLLIAEG
mmetsp:Transcript_42760/g.77245  ORF Transcript_42760/g.77245 Transcript_42760/m.77245 type:complete len:448 (-) Transcript_42760:1145-2488(-)